MGDHAFPSRDLLVHRLLDFRIGGALARDFHLGDIQPRQSSCGFFSPDRNCRDRRIRYSVRSSDAGRSLPPASAGARNNARMAIAKATRLSFASTTSSIRASAAINLSPPDGSESRRVARRSERLRRAPVSRSLPQSHDSHRRRDFQSYRRSAEIRKRLTSRRQRSGLVDCNWRSLAEPMLFGASGPCDEGACDARRLVLFRPGRRASSPGPPLERTTSAANCVMASRKARSPCNPAPALSAAGRSCSDRGVFSIEGSRGAGAVSISESRRRARR